LGKDSSCRRKENLGKAEEKIGRAEDFFSLFFLPPGMAEDFSGKEKEKTTQFFRRTG